MTIRSKPSSPEFEAAPWPPSKEPGQTSRGHFVRIDGEWVNVAEVKYTPRTAAVHQDSMDPLAHPADPFGPPIDSKSRFRRLTKMHGYEEIGNDRNKVKQEFKGMSEADYVDAVKKAINDCRYGESGLSEYERHRCREIDRRRNNHG